METKQDYYTIKDFAEVVGASVPTVRLWIATGRIVAEKRKYKGFRERWFISASEINKVLHN